MSIIIKGGSNSQLANVDTLGNLQVLSTPAAISSVAAPWTSATIDNTTQVLISTGGFPAITLQLNQTSTITDGAVTFEGTYDGINWVPFPAVFVLDPQTYEAIVNPYTLQPNVNKAILLIVGGFQQARVRLDPVISGTGQVLIYWTLLSDIPFQNSSVSTTGLATPFRATLVGGNNAGTFVPLAVDGSGNLDVSFAGSIPAGTNLIGSVKVTDGTNFQPTGDSSARSIHTTIDNASVVVSGTVTANVGSGTWTQNLAYVNGSAVSLGSNVSADSIPVVIASDQSAITVVQSSAANLKATVSQAGAWAVDVSNFPATQPVSIAATVITDPTDRAGRLLGVVYGSQGQQVKQTATNYNLATELYTDATAYDARQIRALTSSDQVTVANSSFAVTGTFWQATQPVSGTVAVSSVSGSVAVQGISAVGTAVSGINPVLIGAKDASGNLADLTVDSSGNLNCNVVVGGGSSNVTIINPLDGSGYVEVDVKTDVTLASGTVTALTPPSASAIASAIVSDPPTVDIKSTTVTTLTPPTAAAIGSAVAAPSAIAIASAIVSNPPTVDIKSTTVTTLTPPTASAIASAIVSNPPTVPLASTTITSLTPPTAAAIGSAVAGALTNPLPVSGTVAVSGVVEVSATGSANSSGNPIFVEAVSGSTTAVTQGTASNLNAAVVGTKTSNGAAGGATNVGVLPAIAGIRSATVDANGNQVALTTDLGGNLLTRFGYNEHPLGDISVAARFNQFEVNFSTAFNASIITNATANAGSATQGSGCATYATGTNAAGAASGTTVQTLNYSPGHSWYALFTASFTAGIASSYQRIGPYNATDGFWIGWEGATFGFTQFQNGSIVTTVAQSSWNGDPLDGSANSKFTKNGSPVAINLAKINIWRIDGAWFGVAPIRLSVFSPDGTWVVCHTFTTFTNALTTPYSYSTTWNLTCAVANTGNTGSLSIVTPCWAVGTSDQTIQLNQALNDYSRTQSVRAIIAGKEPNGNYNNVGLTPDAALTVGGSGDTNVAAATWTTGTQTLVAPVGGATAAATSNVTTLTVTYSPTAGNCAVVMLSAASAGVSAVTVKDNLGHTLSAGPTIDSQLFSFYQLPVPSGVTSYVATWTTGHQATMCVEEYSGVAAVNATLVGNTATATSGTASITVTPNEGGDVVVCGLADAGNTFTGTVGNTRQSTTTSTARMILMDAAATPFTCTATLTSSTWYAVALGLRPTVSGGTPLNTAIVMVNNSFAYNTVSVELVPSGTIAGGTVTSEVSIDNTNWVGIIGVNTGSGTTDTSPIVTLTNANTCLIFNITGYNYFRLRLSAVIAGYLGQIIISYNVQGLASPNVSSTITNGSITVNDNQGLPSSLANAWPVYLTDTVNGPVAITGTSLNVTDAAAEASLSTIAGAVTGTLTTIGPLQTGNAPTYATVGITSGLALASNTSRTAVILTNTSGAVIYLGFGANAAVVGSGVPLFPYGSLSLNVHDNVQQAINAIATVASSNLAIQEFN